MSSEMNIVVQKNIDVVISDFHNMDQEVDNGKISQIDEIDFTCC